jgi:hypothetical protein
VRPNPFIERTCERPLRARWPAAHVERYAPPVPSVVRTCSLAFAGLLLLGGAFGADGQLRDAASRLAPDTSSLTSCPDPSGSGSIRVVVFSQGFEHVSSEVYVQWIEWNQEGPRLLDSVLVNELSSGFWSVGEPVVTSRKNCSMQLQASHAYGSEAARFVLRPAGRGKYSVRRIGNK